LAVAQHNLADVYFKGIPSLDIKPQLWKATEYWSMAAEQFFQPSLMNLGKFYLMGYSDGKEEISVNYGLARDYLERTVALGGPLANEAKELLQAIPPSAPTSWFDWFK
jgi:TPR repeat protein